MLLLATFIVLIFPFLYFPFEAFSSFLSGLFPDVIYLLTFVLFISSISLSLLPLWRPSSGMPLPRDSFGSSSTLFFAP